MKIDFVPIFPFSRFVVNKTSIYCSGEGRRCRVGFILGKSVSTFASHCRKVYFKGKKIRVKKVGYIATDFTAILGYIFCNLNFDSHGKMLLQLCISEIVIRD